MKFLALLLALCAALPLSACSEEDDKSAASDIPASEEFNQADVDFATDMIQHHAQALTMVDLTDQAASLQYAGTLENPVASRGSIG